LFFIIFHTLSQVNTFCVDLKQFFNYFHIISEIQQRLLAIKGKKLRQILACFLIFHTISNKMQV